MSFNGTTDWVELEGFSGITGTNPRTVEAWIRTTSASPGDFISWGANTSGKKWTIRLDNASPFVGRLRLEVGSAWAIGTKVINDGEWHHIAVTYPGGKLSNARLYVDGKPDPIVNIWDTDVNTAVGSAVQISKGFHGRYWQGEIDELRFWNVVRSADEIFASYDCPLPSPAEVPGLVRYYDFNRQEANVLPDLLSNTPGRLHMPTTSWVKSQAAQCITSAANSTSKQFFQLQPNPTTGNFWITMPQEYSGAVTVQIFDTTAKLVHMEIVETPKQKHEMMTDKLSKGIYHVRVRTSDESHTQQLILQ